MEFTDEIHGDQLDQNSTVSGVVYGDLLIPNGVSVDVSGIVHGSVTVESEALAYISGVSTVQSE